MPRGQMPDGFFRTAIEDLTFGIGDILDRGRKTGPAVMPGHQPAPGQHVDIAPDGLDRDIKPLGQFLVRYVTLCTHQCRNFPVAFFC
ncbi:hypothetical protein AA0614_2211 [Komagataeibacter saccharivorans NRIC 0614]|nr:hypothetical protein AA0614_2211 [Komagataeibacter saccharivorans NRIC 0614]